MDQAGWGAGIKKNIVHATDSGGDDDALKWQIDTAGPQECETNNGDKATGTTVLAVDGTTYYHLECTRSGGGASNKAVYHNGASQANGTDATALDFGACALNIGAESDGGGCTAGPVLWWNGVIDELRISKIGRTNHWIRTERNNMNWPNKTDFPVDGFITLGTEQTTAVELMSFEAAGLDRAVDLSWRTGSELRNLGFHLYRATSASGPYDRITTSLIPGLGSSPEGASYGYRDGGLVNGVRYFYQLEDVETTGRTERHGPVEATPAAGAHGVTPGRTPGGGTSTGGGSQGGSETNARLAYGDPSAVSLRILKRTASQAVVELVTGGFYAVPDGHGGVHLEVPGMEEFLDPGLPALPVKRTVLEAVVGRRVRVGSVLSEQELSFWGLVPVLSGAPAAEVDAAGVVRAGIRRALRARRLGPGVFPAEQARVVGTGFQGEQKKALLELWPLRYEASTGRLVLTRRLVVRVFFAGRQSGERSAGVQSAGRRAHQLQATVKPTASGKVLAQLVVRPKGVYRVSFEELFPSQTRGFAVSELRLSRQGEAVAFHVEPAGSRFKPGSVLFFVSEGERLNPYARDAVYELERAAGGRRMSVFSAAPAGPSVDHYVTQGEWEENKTFQAGLLAAQDLWLWQALVAPVERSYSFTVDPVPTATQPSRLRVWLQGGSDQLEAALDHHVRVKVNGMVVGEASWKGAVPKLVEAEVGAGVVLSGANQLHVESVGDAGASSSLVFLDRFALDYPRGLVASGGILEGRFSASGVATVAGLGPASVILDVTTEPARWLKGAVATASGLSFRVEAGRRYLAVSHALSPERRVLVQSPLKSKLNRADYLLVAPRSFLQAAESLLALRQSQGLDTMAVSIEEVFQEFGHGETTPQAIRHFLAYAYHSWQRPSPRYVLLLGDASYDYKDFLRRGSLNPVPPLLMKTSYLWTASDPAYAAVNGEDLLPDLALGRLPAASAEEAQTLVEKIVAFETSGLTLAQGPAVLIADNPDHAGNFESGVHQATPLLAPTHTVEKIFLRDLGGATRPAITAAFDRGAALVSYLGHAGIAVWASENVFNNQDVAALAPQPQQPLLLTFDCLDGYFHFPVLNSLSEELLKAPGKGSIASFSPTGLSLNAAAEVFHQALVQQIASGSHERLGDAVFAAQADFAESGAFPELLSIYHLLGDPALRIR